MLTKIMCALVALLFCIPAIAADKEPLTPEQKKLAWIDLKMIRDKSKILKI